ncbi:MAG: RluA family pseudouridine synthase [Synergistaceae bacterium]|nr:RluA family pseudouridine synthase [Candidatus Equadaptatus faecalis]
MGFEFHVTEDQEDRRVDRLLRSMFPQIPLSAVMKALRKGEVRLDARKVSPDTRVKTGQFIQLPWSDKPVRQEASLSVRNSAVPKLETLYRDENVWIINKPAGLLTQPDVKGADSVYTRVMAELEWKRTDFRPSTVQRLDRNTSGIVIAALSGKFQRLLSELIREKRIEKIYRTVVEGALPEQGRIDFPLLKDPDTNTVKVDSRGQSALTLYKRLACGNGLSCAEVRLVTGRTHQIRVHFSAAGYPVLGDRKYGSGSGRSARTLLHAYRVVFPADERLGGLSEAAFIAPLPDDMLKYFKQGGKLL